MSELDSKELDVRYETSVSGATYSDGSFVGLFFTSKWGDFTKACERIANFKPTEYRKTVDEEVFDYALRLIELEKILNERCVGKATFNLRYQNYKIHIYDPQYLNPSYALRTERKPRRKKDKPAENSN